MIERAKGSRVGGRDRGAVSGLYLLHFDPPYKHAGHYLGWAKDIDARLGAHMRGTGARLVAVAVAAGCRVELVRVWGGWTRKDEARLKKQGSRARLCPICAGRG